MILALGRLRLKGGKFDVDLSFIANSRSARAKKTLSQKQKTK